MLEEKTLVAILKNDSNLTPILKKYYIIKDESDYDISIRNQVDSDNEINYVLLADLLIKNESYINNTTINDLLLEEFLKQEINIIFNITTADNTLLHQIFYSFKYSTIKTFFYDKRNQFLPEIDILNIEDKTKEKLFYEALMKEFDKFSSIINQIADIYDIDKIPVEYVEYLGQLLGYDKQEHILINDEKYRILIKNIIELYKIKGTNYSIELFFNFLGYAIEIQEFWFDRRFANYIYNQNPYTGEIDKTLFTFYLTPLNPSDNLMTSYYPKEFVSVNGISQQFNIFNFNVLSQKYGPNVVLGYKKSDTNNKYNGEFYKYFKTNIINFKITVLPDTNVTTGEKELAALNKYIDFLIPINLIRFVSFSSLFSNENAGYQDINGISTRALQIDELKQDTKINYYSDSFGDIKKFFEKAGGAKLLFSRDYIPTEDGNEYMLGFNSTDYFSFNNDDSLGYQIQSFWTSEPTSDPMWIRYSLDKGASWIGPFEYDYSVIIKLLQETINEDNAKDFIINFSTDYYPLIPQTATWKNFIYVNDIWMKYSFDDGATWSTPMLFKTNDIVENSLIYDYKNGKRDNLKEKYFNTYFIFAREPENELTNLSSYYTLNYTNGRLHSNSSSKLVENSNQQEEYPIEKIIYLIDDEIYGKSSEVWITNPYNSFNPLLNSSINLVEVKDAADPLLNGVYNIFSTKVEDGYYKVLMENMPWKNIITNNEIGFGGTISFITNVGYQIYAITLANENNNSVIRIKNPYTKVPNFTRENKALKNNIPSTVSISYLTLPPGYYDDNFFNEKQTIMNKTYAIKNYAIKNELNTEYLDIEIERITDLVMSFEFSSVSKGLLFIDKQKLTLNKYKHNFMDNKDFKWFKITY